MRTSRLLYTFVEEKNKKEEKCAYKNIQSNLFFHDALFYSNFFIGI